MLFGLVERPTGRFSLRGFEAEAAGRRLFIELLLLRLFWFCELPDFGFRELEFFLFRVILRRLSILQGY
jgi:hypothetical protein